MDRPVRDVMSVANAFPKCVFVPLGTIWSCASIILLPTIAVTSLTGRLGECAHFVATDIASRLGLFYRNILLEIVD